jgi:dolichol-phosphate mannosyltransferase
MSVRPFHDVFATYELLAHVSVRAPQLDFKVKEITVTRSHPPAGKIPPN